MKKIHRIAVGLLFLSLLFTAGCSDSGEPPTTSSPAIPTESVVTEPAETTGAMPEAATLETFRQSMAGTSALYAVAYFGYQDTMDSDLPVDPYTVMQEQAPKLCEDHPFLLEIPTERVIGNHGDLFCIVPLDPSATVAVSRGSWEETAGEYIYEESLYLERSGEPILLFCNHAGFEPDTQLSITGPSGNVIWYPMIDDNCCAAPLRNDNWDDLFLDFSPYREMLLTKHRDMVGEWVLPTAEMLPGTTWIWKGYRKDGLETSYRVTFEEDILSVRWNDGIDEEDHVYPDARWELTHEDGFAVLSIDFREMAGVLNYNLLYHEDFGQIYVAMDALQEEMSVGWEPLYRFLSQSMAPEPLEMLGTWELAWTEVEGDRQEAEPGTCSIGIQMSASSGLLMSYTSHEFPNNNFENELLIFDEREMYYECGNDAWVADLDYVGPWDTTYAVTLTEDGILIKQNYFLVDGAPMVSYEYFRRIGE